MGLLGVATGEVDTLDRSAFRSSWSIPEGASPAVIHEAKVIDVNMVNWTVDCVSAYDQKRFFDIQVASPYLHSNQGDGIYAVPEIGSKCMVCIPSDGPPPFVLAFIMPPESRNPNDEVDEDTTEPETANYTFQGGREQSTPGDIVLKGRDGQFIKLHRGGVLQFGSTQLAQRICIPLGNLVTDISQNYAHFNTGGSINWGLRSGSPEENPETEYRQTFRVYANDEFADVRLSFGNIHNPLPEPVGDAGSSADLAALGIGSAIKVLEFVLAVGGFDDNGQAPNPKVSSQLRVFVDRDGNAMLRAEGAVSFRTKKKLRIRADEGFEVYTPKSVVIEAEEGLRLQGKNLELATSNGTVTINGGSKPVATVGSQVLVTIPPGIVVTGSFGTGTIVAGSLFYGSVTTGNPTIKV